MSLSVYPVAVSSSASTLAKTVTATSANTLYSATTELSSGTYTITCSSSTITTVDFYNGSTYIGTAVTVSGTVNYNLASDATSFKFYTNTGSNIVISLQLTGQSISPVSGTLDIITTSSTYNQTGLVYAIAIGGGGGGGSASSGYAGGGGGGSGGIAQGRLVLSGPTSITVGAAGGVNGDGGASTISNLTANGGIAGTPPNNNANGGGAGGGGAGGTPGGAAGGSGAAHIINTGNSNASGPGVASASSQFPFIVSGTTGSGQGGNPRDQVYNYSAAGSGIGTGGIPNAGPSGYGSGGVGKSVYTGAQDGRPGVVYVVRGI